MKNILKILYRWWMKFAYVLGTVNGIIILTVFYIVVIGLYALPMRLISLFKKQKTAPTYWQDKKKIENTKEHLTYQF